MSEAGPNSHEVAAYLRRHPRFLSQFPDLVLSLEVPRGEGATTSLASYQLEVLRDKNRELGRRLNELFGNAQDNERLAIRSHQLSLALLRATGLTSCLQALAACLVEDFGSELVRLILHRCEAAALPDWVQLIAADDVELLPFREFLQAGEPLCGRVHADKLEVLFRHLAAEVASVALIAMPGIGVLAIGSRDGNHFFPGMGTLFLRLIGESCATALGRYGTGQD
jgi:uncharacterized protein YigA (DUF484 family)